MTDDDSDITVPMYRCKDCGERFDDPIRMPGRTVTLPGKDPERIDASVHCKFCRGERLERWK